MTDLPYRLSEGVMATREGILFESGDYRSSLSALVESAGSSREILGFKRMIAWHGLAKRLRYREGEPWCATQGAVIICVSGKCHRQDPLHRLAAILCDDAKAFRILYEAIEEFGDE